MFSISFGEMVIILMVCLLVVGPKRLPSMARFCGHFISRLNRQATAIKREIKREMEIEDLRQAKEEAEQAAMEVEGAVKGAVNDLAKMPDKPSVQARKD